MRKPSGPEFVQGLTSRRGIVIQGHESLIRHSILLQSVLWFLGVQATPGRAAHRFRNSLCLIAAVPVAEGPGPASFGWPPARSLVSLLCRMTWRPTTPLERG